MPPSSSSAAKPEKSVSAGQPDKQEPYPLAELNKASAKAGGTWVLWSYRPYEDTYEWNSKGKSGTATTFNVMLVAEDNPAQYCLGRLKKTGRSNSKYEQITSRLREGKKFVFSKVKLMDDQKTKYISCPIKTVVDLGSTIIDECVEGQSSAVQPAPQGLIATSEELQSDQFFDITALVHNVDETKDATNNRSFFTVGLYDGSLDKETQKVKIMPVTMWIDTPRETLDDTGSITRKLIEDHMKSKKPLSFFCLSGSQDDQSRFSFRSTKHTFVVAALGTKAEKMENATELHRLSADQTSTFALQAPTAARDWSKEKGMETKCAILANFARKSTGNPAIDDNPGGTVWQINWLHIAEPPQDISIRNQFGNIWLPLDCVDETGPIRLYITEKAAVKLFNVVDAAEFEQYHSEQRLRVPFFASVKVYRKRANVSAEQPGSSEVFSTPPQKEDNEFNSYIVDAAEQDMTEALSIVSVKLLPQFIQTGDSILPAMLPMIRTSDHHTMAVAYAAQEVPPELSAVASKTKVGEQLLRPCLKAYALVRSTGRSEVIPSGVSGFKLFTRNVTDLLDPNGSQFELTTHCTLDNVTDFKLDPIRGQKDQAALVCVTQVISDESDNRPIKGFVVESIQRLENEQAEGFKPMLKSMMHFAALAGQITRKRDREPMSPEENPSTASSCRTLGRSPTGPPVPEYSSTP